MLDESKAFREELEQRVLQFEKERVELDEVQLQLSSRLEVSEQRLLLAETTASENFELMKSQGSQLEEQEEVIVGLDEELANLRIIIQKKDEELKSLYASSISQNDGGINTELLSIDQTIVKDTQEKDQQVQHEFILHLQEKIVSLKKEFELNEINVCNQQELENLRQALSVSERANEELKQKDENRLFDLEEKLGMKYTII